ncbi:MAG: DUF308 domain-containing protein [Arthrobacter sp.]|jgi:uncharacterized membrane protein HdeD (DUF308 family)|nr:DUF308 domain-containing protein [Arthrobacter sp.]
MTASTSSNPLENLTDELRSTGFKWLLIRGILGILLGLVLFIAPGIGGTAIAVVVVYTLAFWLVLDGFATCSLAWREKREGLKGWGWALASGIVSIIAGVLAVIFPVSTGAFMGVLFLWFMTIGLIGRGIAGLGDRSMGGWSIALGILDIIIGIWFAVALFTDPTGMVITALWVAGIYGVVFGVASIMMAFKIRKLGKA